MVFNIKFHSEEEDAFFAAFSFSVSTLKDTELLSFGRSMSYFLVNYLGVVFDEVVFIDRVWYECDSLDLGLSDKYLTCDVPRTPLEAGLFMRYRIFVNGERRIFNISDTLRIKTHAHDIVKSIKKNVSNGKKH